MTFLEMCGSIGYQPKNLNEMPIFGYFHVDLLTTSLLFVFLLFLLKPRIIPWLGENQTVPSSWDMVPQPSIFRIIWEWKVMRNPKLRMMGRFKIGRDLGPIYRVNLLGDENVVLNKPKYAEALLSSKNMGHLSKSLTINAPLVPILGKDGLVLSKGQVWHTDRKLLSKAFTFNALCRYIKVFNKCSKRLVSDLHMRFSSPEEYNQLNTLLHTCGLDIITETSMGVSTFQHGKEAGIIAQELDRLKRIYSYRFERWWLLTIPILWKLHPLSKKAEEAVAQIDSTVAKIISQYRGLVKNGKVNSNEDSFNNMMELMVKSGVLTPEQILDETKTMIIAGYETTTTTMHFLLFMLALHQDHQKACRDEVDKAFEACPDGNLTSKELSGLKYLERCITETQRLFPIIHTITRKLEAPLKINNDLVLPIGATAVVPIISLHRSAETFPQPNKFDPDRFLPENSVSRHSHAFVGFSAGPRACLGMKYAILQAKTVMAHVLREFEIYTSDKVDDVALLLSFVLLSERDYNFRLRKRHN